jgi:hypothetical protein
MTVPCKACGRRVRWAVSPTGADLPLEEVYAYWLEPGIEGGRPRAVRSEAPVWIAHHLTCKDRDRVSRGRREADG